MVMGRRPEVQTAPLSIAAFAMTGLMAQMLNALASLPFRRPWAGDGSGLHNVGVAVSRTTVRAFMGYVTSLPTQEFRSVELAIDAICRVILPPFVARLGATMEETRIGDVPGLYYRPRSAESRGTILYLHGGGYIGTSPSMYAAFTAQLVHETGCDVFVPDYRLAPEFPFPASLIDAISVYDELLAKGLQPARLFVAGDSGGGGLVNGLMLDVRARHLPKPAGLLLFSPEVSLTLDEPSITENADVDILPWNIPVRPYLQGVDFHDWRVSPINADLRRFPPTLVAFGSDEMFRDGIRRFIARLKDEDVEVITIEEAHMFHVFPIVMPWADASARVYRAVGDFVTERLSYAGTTEAAEA
jgi:monoterpene epsilon-lactone hydrolase